MSRIGNLPIEIPAGVTIAETNGRITVTGPRGTLTRRLVPKQTLVLTASEAKVQRANNERSSRALHGLMRQLLANMVTGVTAGFTKRLEMKGTGYRAEVQGNDLVLHAGYSHPVRLTAPEGISFKVEKNVQITVEGSDKEAVGEVAANIRAVRKPEPYKGKGIRYSDEVIRRKPGKAAAAKSAA